MGRQKFHAFMFPMFAFGHMTPYLHLANKLAEKASSFTYHCSSCDGLPAGTDTVSDIPVTLWKFFTEAFDLTRDQVEAAWQESIVKSMMYNIVSANTIAHDLVPGAELGVPPPGYPSSKVLYRAHDAHALLSLSVYYNEVYFGSPQQLRTAISFE
ncbi:unnamed protein product [Microthlaspi erraticum]|uniref:Uncharacterized protein n=1 Tax=Microthlaspi erraticum TaxID=1685480 RepID=A0A6D2L8A2_9BRAS|nr:unnamed protein product [Microthlaspi erraticum]